jgi:threonine synthase
MNYYSTNNINSKVDFRHAILKGLADDKGLFMPEEIIPLSKSFLDNLSQFSFQEIAYEVVKNFVGDEIPSTQLNNIINTSISFDAPLVNLSENLSILELFHGPTFAFKDFGARFMARTMEYFLKDIDKDVTILVATSGDTGSAVANGFLNVKGINVLVLFPSGKISKIQEKQITTLDNNITAIEVDGSFDDCQRLVKTAFVDGVVKEKLNLSSANSINIGRLIPQTFYYFESFKQLKNGNKEIVYSVPSGNLGNLTAGLFAKGLGLPINKFIAATNKNDVFTNYINTEKFIPRPSEITISNAMDVGDPSNFARIMSLYKSDHKRISDIIFSKSFLDDEIIEKIKELSKKYNYIIDPHGAVGCLAFDDYKKNVNNNCIGVVLETAHPAKFSNVFEDHLYFTPEIPESLQSCMDKKGSTIKISKEYDNFKELLLERK